MSYAKVICLLLAVYVHSSVCQNKYSAQMNVKTEADVNFRTLHKPFRMAKLNMLWTKAQLRLTEPKLKSLFSDLRIHDKEELILKKVKSEGGDSDGIKEADLRMKLTGIMSTYGLLEHFETIHDKAKYPEHEPMSGKVEDHINRSLFKDKKLNKLWMKAETAGFRPEELHALKEEFTHHQDKIDQYYELYTQVHEEDKKDKDENAVDNEELERFNLLQSELDTNEISKDYLHQANLLRSSHQGLRDGFDRLHRLTAKGPNSKDFIEPKVQGLWKLALEADFKPAELESLKVELKHYEVRLLRLRELHAQHVNILDKQKLNNKVAGTGDKLDNFNELETDIKKHSSKLEHLHNNLHNKILQRHGEL